MTSDEWYKLMVRCPSLDLDVIEMEEYNRDREASMTAAELAEFRRTMMEEN